ncbi:MAG: pantothenate kinase [Candidatus Brockarchaeota archaeon]|nr:pantothenate kinase [Candidatus Brockarchaeota archaeon]
MKIAVGIDIGGSTTKAVALKGKEILGVGEMPSSDPLATSIGLLGKLIVMMGCSLKDVEVLAIAGGRSSQLPDSILGLRVVKVNEIVAAGTGGIVLTGLDEALVVSMGTGTALIEVRENGKRIRHIGGTGVGGGTLLGLARKMLGISSIGILVEMAEKGDPRRVDLTVGEIVGDGIGILSAEMTASNLGRVGDTSSPEDLAAGIANLVGEVVASVTFLAASKLQLEDKVILVGRVAKLPPVLKSIQRALSSFGVKLMVPKLPEYAVAVGAGYRVSAEDDPNACLIR